ncbi:MAG: glycosyltransferase [Patescibacteria group bacterium]|nr:glycosyltransferase [Patescibacteria group bacterium]
MMFDLCVPARNEGATIQDALRRLTKSLSDLGIDWQITVAINGTTDDTVQKINAFELRASRPHRQRSVAGAASFEIRALERPEAGKGAAIRLAAQNSQADIFGFIDADLSADPDMIAPMVKKILDGQADVVIGSRLADTRTTNRSWLRTMSSQFFNLMSRLILGLKVKDAQCGLKVMNSRAKNVLVNCQEEGWFLDIEFLAKMAQDGFKVVEVPVPWIEFLYTMRQSQVRMFKDGLGAIKAMWRIRHRLKNHV